jgi:hypothetical protein
VISKFYVWHLEEENAPISSKSLKKLDKEYLQSGSKNVPITALQIDHDSD